MTKTASHNALSRPISTQELVKHPSKSILIDPSWGFSTASLGAKMNTRHKNWALLIVVALVCFFAPKPIAVGLLGAKSYTPWVFMALQILLPFVALPLVRSLWPSHTKRAFAIFYLLANWPLILSVVVGGGWALTCFFISGPCH